MNQRTGNEMDQDAAACAAAMVAVLSDDMALTRLTREGERLSHAHGRRSQGELTDSEERSLTRRSRAFLDRITAALGATPHN